MKRFTIFFVLSLVVIGAATWVLENRWNGAETRSARAQMEQTLRREARLIEYFCFSRVPPVMGQVVIPSEWEKALDTKIRLREGVGEAASEAPGLKEKADEIRKLEPGQSVGLETGSGSARLHVLVYRPNAAGTQYLILTKSAGAGIGNDPSADKPGALRPLLGSLLSALALTIIARWLWPPRTAA